MTRTELPWLLLILTVVASLITGCWLAMWCVRVTRKWRIAAASCDAARRGEAIVTRALQMFAHELKALGLTLRGHADQLIVERHAHASAMATAAAQLDGLADELGHHLIPDGGSRALNCELIELTLLVQDAIAGMAVAISPGRRQWRVAEPPTPIGLWADYRAMRLVLERVLGEAVRSSAHDDWIEVGWSAASDGLVIRIEDEGAGSSLAAPSGGELDTRGIGLRLSLARTLTQAHGGALDVEALARVGTRVTVTLPAERLRPVNVAGGVIAAAHHMVA